MGQCLNCKKEIEEYTGRRPKKYCSDACRQKFFQAKKKTNPAPVKTESKAKATLTLDEILVEAAAKSLKK